MLAGPYEDVAGGIRLDGAGKQGNHRAGGNELTQQLVLLADTRMWTNETDLPERSDAVRVEHGDR
ncbi:hypothetical protein GCM10009655_12160 [Rhodoglobus aureus]|uniref:Uncharacterized protein n=1 Tax=Rhodoglobus aureus TaxID=191497 RepID=A0ABN1VLA7_9MICO